MIKLSENLAQDDRYRSIILDERPIIDLRAPVEFSRGTIPGAVNLPLLDDAARAAVGKVYKREGQSAATALGLKLVSGDVKKARIGTWRAFAALHPTALFMCFRGGQRSAIAQQWLADEAGLNLPRIAGGYKAMRNFLLSQFSVEQNKLPFVLLGGHTGAAKTELIKRLDNAIDLEGLAAHRGSAFGNYIAAQPSQIDFENSLAKKLIALNASNVKAIVLEKESKNIGKSRLPDQFYQKMMQSPVVVLEVPLAERIDNTWRDYVVSDRAKYSAHYGADGIARWSEHLRSSMLRLTKRLGGDRTQHVVRLFDEACASADLTAHKTWIEFLLVNYYDPTYSYYRNQWSDRIIFRGDRHRVERFLKTYY